MAQETKWESKVSWKPRIKKKKKKKKKKLKILKKEGGKNAANAIDRFGMITAENCH